MRVRAVGKNTVEPRMWLALQGSALDFGIRSAIALAGDNSTTGICGTGSKSRWEEKR